MVKHTYIYGIQVQQNILIIKFTYQIVCTFKKILLYILCVYKYIYVYICKDFHVHLRSQTVWQNRGPLEFIATSHNTPNWLLLPRTTTKKSGCNNLRCQSCWVPRRQATQHKHHMEGGKDHQKATLRGYNRTMMLRGG